MYLNFKVSPYSIKESTNYAVDILNNKKPFPMMSIDVDSYIVNAKLETSLDFHVGDGVHNFQIGRYSSLAEDLLFLIDINHDYTRICTGVLSAFRDLNFKGKLKRKGQVIIQNDCWIGNGVTIVGGVTVHNGAVLAAESVITKDVPPYAIVGGNPARIIKYRFDEQQIQDLQRIAWWDWSQDKIKRNAKSFHGDVSEFISEHIDEANQALQNVAQLPLAKATGVQLTYLFIPDFYEPYPIYEKVIDEFARCFDGERTEMLIYIRQDAAFKENTLKISSILEKYPDRRNLITICTEKVEDERSLFRAADCYITTRAKENVQRMCFADLYNVKCISGVDMPVFR